MPIACQSVDDLPSGVWEQLEAINDTEILWQEVNRFLSDRFYKSAFNK